MDESIVGQKCKELTYHLMNGNNMSLPNTDQGRIYAEGFLKKPLIDNRQRAFDDYDSRATRSYPEEAILTSKQALVYEPPVFLSLKHRSHGCLTCNNS